MSSDHAELFQYIKDAKLAPLTSEGAKAITAAFTSKVVEAVAFVNRGSIQCLPLPQQQTTDALYWTLFGQLAADVVHNREDNPVGWYNEYVNVLGRIGMRAGGWTRNSADGSQAGASVDATVLLYLKAFLSPTAQGKLAAIIEALKSSANQGALSIFNTDSSSSSSANFQVSDGTVDTYLNLTIHVGFMDFKTNQNITNLLFFRWSNRNFTFYYSGDTLTLAKSLADALRNAVADRLVDHIIDNIDDIQLS